MVKLLLTALLLLPAAAYSQALSAADLESRPYAGEDSAVPAQRPDAQRIMSELSTGLRLSSKQEDRIGAAVRKKTSEFDRLLKEYEKNTAEEKKWRLKANEARYGMLKISREMPDTVREYLDDEQREAYDELLDASQKPAAKPGAARPPAKKKIIKRKKAAAPAAVEEEAGQVLVDGDVPAPAPKKRVIKRKKAAPAPERGEQGFPPGSRNNPAAAALAEEAGDEDIGSYP